MNTLRESRIRRKLAAAGITAITAAAVLTGAQQAKAQENLTGLALSGGANFLFNFSTANPSNVSNFTVVTGLDAGFLLEDIDYRPTTDAAFNGVLYGLGKSTAAGATSSLRLYTLNATTGAVLSSTLLDNGATFLNANYSIDFNPAANALRVVNDAGNNYRIGNPGLASGATITDGAFNGVSPTTGILGAAYTNNFGGTGSTSLYEVSFINAPDTLYLQNPANSGTLAAIGTNLGVDLALGGFDISGVTGNAYYGGGNNLYQINLANGTATSLGSFGFNTNATTVRGIAAQVGTAAPEPGSLVLVGMGLLGMVGGFAKRRRK